MHSCLPINYSRKWLISWFVSFFCQVIAVSPHLCPMSVAATLVSVGNDEGNDSDRLRNACVATLCELGNTVFLFHWRMFWESKWRGFNCSFLKCWLGTPVMTAPFWFGFVIFSFRKKNILFVLLLYRLAWSRLWVLLVVNPCWNLCQWWNCIILLL